MVPQPEEEPQLAERQVRGGDPRRGLGTAQVDDLADVLQDGPGCTSGGRPPLRMHVVPFYPNPTRPAGVPTDRAHLDRRYYAAPRPLPARCGFETGAG
jgi:hypothetical protein